MTVTWRDYWELTKPRIAFLVLVTAALGFFWGGQGIHAPLLFCCLLVGTGLTTCGSSVLNHYLERDVDGLMKRTRNRPLPAGRVKPGMALSMGFALVLGGVFFLLFTAGLLTAFLALLTAFLYVVHDSRALPSDRGRPALDPGLIAHQRQVIGVVYLG